jgi:hypothetical protein
MKKIQYLLVAITSFTLVFVDCNDDSVKPPVNPNEDGEWRSDDKTLAGTSWKLSGVVDVSTGVMSFPSICPTIYEDRMCYSLNFNADGNLNTYSSANEYWGTYGVEVRGDGDKTVYRININDFTGTKRYGEECDDGDELWRKSFSTVNSFALHENELKLFYNDNQNYLLFLRYSSEHRGDNDMFLLNCGLSNDFATVIYGEDGELCIFDEPSGTCYKMTLADTRWKLIEVSATKNHVSKEVIDYSGKNIVYEFNGNDKLIVSGKIDAPFVSEDFKEGEHSYRYRMSAGCNACDPGPNFMIDSKNIYSACFGDEKMYISYFFSMEISIGENHYNNLFYKFQRLGNQSGGTDDSSNVSVREPPRILRK